MARRWNPAVEQQAQDRIHRLGQYKPIHVTRFIIGGTIEERILKLQARAHADACMGWHVGSDRTDLLLVTCQ